MNISILSEKFTRLSSSQRILSIILLIGVILFMSGFFWQEKYSRLHTLYFILVVLPSLFLIPVFINDQLHKNKLFLLVFVFFLYSLLSVFWGSDFHLSLLGKYLKRIGLLIVLFYAIYHIILYYPYSEKLLFILLMMSGFCLATYSISHYFINGSQGRLYLWGVLDNPIASATVFGALFLLSAKEYLCTKNYYLLLIYFLLCLLFVLEMLLTKSRGPQLALIFTIPLLFFFIKPVGYKRLSYPLFVFMVLILTAIFFTDFLELLFSRGFHLSFRDIIWRDSVFLSLEKPFFGYGLGTDFSFVLPGNDLNNWHTSTVSHSHNIILSTWLYTGFVGVAFFITIIYYAVRVSLNNNKKSFIIFGVIIMYGVLCLLTNSSFSISRPNERWFVFWMPLAFIIAHSAQQEIIKNKAD